MRYFKRATEYVSMGVIALLLMSLLICLSPASVSAQSEAQWHVLEIPNLPDGVTLGGIWTGGPDDTYIWGGRVTPGTTDVPESTLYHWNGATWEVSLHLPEHQASDVFGTSSGDVFVSANKCSLGYAAGCGADRGGRVFRTTDGGLSWVPQVLPPEVGTNSLGGISGTPDNVHIRGAENYVGIVIQFDASTWTTHPGGGDRMGTITVFSPDEGYYGTCWGWGRWDGNTWQYDGDQFDFCDINKMWGMRDGTGDLHLYVVGSNNFGNGVRVWRFNEATQSFGSKQGYVFGDGDGYLLGWANGIWGSAPDDIYVTGALGEWNDPIGATSGRIYHYDGATWQQVTEVGDIAKPGGISGSSADNIWVSLRDGKVLRYGLPAPATELRAVPSAAEVYPGDVVTVDLNILEATDLYASQATCSIDPAVLEPQSAAFGDFFDPVNRLVGANSVDPVAGTWLGAISQASPAGPLSGDGLFATVTYQALAPGTTSISCEVLFSDRDGFVLPVSFTGVEVTVLPYASIDGVATYQGRLDHTGIEVTATGPVTRTDTTDVDGNFALDELRAGSYDIEADGLSYLPVCTTQALNAGDEITLAATTLVGGDVNDDDVIDIGDATLIGNNFGLDVPPGDAAADINADSIVNVQDLAILGGNYELAGCQAW